MTTIEKSDSLEMIIETPETSIEDRIRAAAFQLWNDEGQPEACAENHWFRACEMIANEDMKLTTETAPGWLQRNAETAEVTQAPAAEKTELSKSIDEIKKRMIGRAA